MEHRLFAERLKIARKKNGHTQDEFAKRVGISRSMVQIYETGKGLPRQKTLEHMAAALGVTVAWLCGEFVENNERVILPGTEDLVFIPTAAPSLSESGGLQIAIPPIGRPFFKTWVEQLGFEKTLVLVKAVTNDMAPTIMEGDCALINTSKQEIISGKIFAVGFNKRVHLFRIFLELDRMVITGDNKEPRPFILALPLENDSVSILGRAVWWEHIERPLD